MNIEQLKDWLGIAWRERLSEIYRRGMLNNPFMVQAALFHYLNTPELPHVRVWLSQSIEFPTFKEEDYLDWQIYHHKKKLMGQVLDLIITNEEEVLAIGLLNVEAGGYGDFREHLELMETFHQIRGKGELRMRIHPHHGKLDENHTYLIREDTLLVYGVINQEASMSLEWDKLKAHCKDPLFWYHFYFLQGKIGDSKIKFLVKEGKKFL